MTLQDIEFHVAFHVCTYNGRLDGRQSNPQNGEMLDLELVLQQAKKCVSPDQIAELIEEHQDILLEEIETGGDPQIQRVLELRRGPLRVKALPYWKLSMHSQCWRGSFDFSGYPIGMGLGILATPILELFPIKVTDMRGRSTRLGTELSIHDWGQMFAYRMLSGIDTPKI